jgi:hypothetical protein
MRKSLITAVGGAAALDDLDDRPLPDEPFAGAGIAADIRPLVDEILRLCDACCDALLDAEYRTATRRLLARAAIGDPGVFRRKAKATNAAAALCWAVARANGRFDSYPRDLTAKDLQAHFGLSGSVTQRAATILRAAGIEARAAHNLSLESPDLLVSTRRRQIIQRRDRHQPKQ